MDYAQLLALAQTHQWLALAVLIIGWITEMSRPESKFPINIPDRFRPLFASIVGAIYGVLLLRQQGDTWQTAMIDGFKSVFGTPAMAFITGPS